jgi:hypothetical protein
VLSILNNPHLNNGPAHIIFLPLMAPIDTTALPLLLWQTMLLGGG